jgi:hypothetical protein
MKHPRWSLLTALFLSVSQLASGENRVVFLPVVSVLTETRSLPDGTLEFRSWRSSVHIRNFGTSASSYRTLPFFAGPCSQGPVVVEPDHSRRLAVSSPGSVDFVAIELSKVSPSQRDETPGRKAPVPPAGLGRGYGDAGARAAARLRRDGAGGLTCDDEPHRARGRRPQRSMQLPAPGPPSAPGEPDARERWHRSSHVRGRLHSPRLASSTKGSSKSALAPSHNSAVSLRSCPSMVSRRQRSLLAVSTISGSWDTPARSSREGPEHAARGLPPAEAPLTSLLKSLRLNP